MIDFAVLAFGCGPVRPAIGRIEDVVILLAGELGLDRALALQLVQIFEEKKPGALLGVVEFARAPGVLPQHVVDILESLFKHEGNGPCPGPLGAGGLLPPRKPPG